MMTEPESNQPSSSNYKEQRKSFGKNAKSKNWDILKTNDPVSPTNQQCENKAGRRAALEQKGLKRHNSQIKWVDLF